MTGAVHCATKKAKTGKKYTTCWKGTGKYVSVEKSKTPTQTQLRKKTSTKRPAERVPPPPPMSGERSSAAPPPPPNQMKMPAPLRPTQIITPDVNKLKPPTKLKGTTPGQKRMAEAVYRAEARPYVHQQLGIAQRIRGERN